MVLVGYALVRKGLDYNLVVSTVALYLAHLKLWTKCNPRNSHVEILNPNMIVLGAGPEVNRSRCRALRNEISALIKETSETLSTSTL